MHTRGFKIFLVVIVLVCAALLKFRAVNQKPFVPADTLPDEFLVVLGVAQDAGYPQIGCDKECCDAYWKGKEGKKLVSCLALVDRPSKKYWLIEATPDITVQLKNLQALLPVKPDYSPDGIFLTHAHTGHYTGLMQLGREAMGANGIPVFVMPRMDSFLRNNGPWSQLVQIKNIALTGLKEDSLIKLSGQLSITPWKVPHRDEYSETIGFVIRNGTKKVLFIPDIDKWEKWDRDIKDLAKDFSVVLIDGTFYKEGELPGRNMKEVPHPFVEETARLMSGLPDSVKTKIHFIHFNHTNPLIRKTSKEKDQVRAAGFNVAEEGMIFKL
jgi:pyrroloquinoline quinone biosynthesis protein B